jgi:hypothetical protein
MYSTETELLLLLLLSQYQPHSGYGMPAQHSER